MCRQERATSEIFKMLGYFLATLRCTQVAKQIIGLKRPYDPQILFIASLPRDCSDFLNASKDGEHTSQGSPFHLWRTLTENAAHWCINDLNMNKQNFQFKTSEENREKYLYGLEAGNHLLSKITKKKLIHLFTFKF